MSLLLLTILFRLWVLESWLADDWIVFIGLFDEVCDKFNISVPATGGNGSSDGGEVRAEKWTMDDSGSYGGGGGGGGNGYGGGGSWRSGAASSDALLGWTFGSVACAIALGIML